MFKILNSCFPTFTKQHILLSIFCVRKTSDGLLDTIAGAHPILLRV